MGKNTPYKQLGLRYATWQFVYELDAAAQKNDPSDFCIGVGTSVIYQFHSYYHVTVILFLND
jgi:hypothetical protein